MVSQINQSNIELIRAKMQEALNAAGKEFGLKISLGNIRFDSFGFTFKGETKIVGDISNPAEIEANRKREWDAKCGWLGLKPEHYGKIVWLRGESYILRGVSTKKSKFNIDVQRMNDGKKFRLSHRDVQNCLAQNQREAA